MNSIRTLLTLAVTGILATVVQAQQLVTIALEDRNVQTGASSTSLTEYVFFASVEGYAGVTGGTVQADSGFLSSPTALVNHGDFYEYEATRGTLGDAITAFPLNATYSIVTTGTPAGTETITGPGGLFSDRVPTTPVFTLGGVTGTWSGSTFSFNPVGITSFTITLNNYSTLTPGGNYAYYMEANNGMGVYDEVGGGPLTDATPYTAPVFTFTNGAAADGGDTDPSTFGFTAGSSFNLEAGFFNVVGLSAATGMGSGQKAFVIGTTTSFTLQAIPEPSTYAAIFGGLALVGVMIHRRRRTV